MHISSRKQLIFVHLDEADEKATLEAVAGVLESLGLPLAELPRQSATKIPSFFFNY